MELDIAFLDDATRPKAPPIPGATETQRQRGRGLARFHAYHLHQLRQLRQAFDALAAGRAGAEALADSVATLDMVENYRRFGSLCGAECHALTMHHTIEDYDIFPHLRKASEGLRKVVDRLSAEHVVIHELLERLDAATRAVAHDPDEARFVELEAVIAALERVVPSHFGYEEAEIAEALGYYGFPL